MNCPSQSCLDLVEHHFATLTGGARPLSLDGDRLHCGLPHRPVPLDELRRRLLKPGISPLTKNAAWAEIVRKAHAQPDPWVMAAAGMLIPGLKRIGGKLSGQFRGDRCDLDSEILEGFINALHCADPRSPKLYGQFYWAALRRGHKACEREDLSRQHVELTDQTRHGPVRARAGNPDLVLAKALREGVVTARQADLVCTVYLDHARRIHIASRLGLNRYRIGLELAAAKRKLTAYLAAA